MKKIIFLLLSLTGCHHAHAQEEWPSTLWELNFDAHKLSSKQRKMYQDSMDALAKDCKYCLDQMEILTYSITSFDMQDSVEHAIKGLIAGFMCSNGSVKTSAIAALANLAAEVGGGIWRDYNEYKMWQSKLHMHFNQYRVVATILENDR